MKRMISLLLTVMLALTALLPSAFAEDEDLDMEEIIEDVVLDEEGNEILVDEQTGEQLLLSSSDEEKLDELTAQYEIDDSVDPDSMEINPDLPENIINILLVGVDVKGTDSLKRLADQGKYAKRADVIMILSINTDNGDLKLSSIARNTYMEIPGRKNKGMIANSYGNAIYENGKYKAWNDTPALVARTVNHNFGLNIEHYVVINFYGVAQIVESLGGVDIDLTKAEAKAINAYLRKNRRAISRTYDDKDGQRDALETKAGVQHLDGIQALMYARLRSIDNDLARTARTRNLLDCLLQSVVGRIRSNSLNVMDLIITCVDYMVTNMNLKSIGQIAMGVLNSGIMDRLDSSDSLISQFRIPMEGYFRYETIDGSSVNYMSDENFRKTRDALHSFIYGTPAAEAAE